jgi:hypothetical protein
MSEEKTAYINLSRFLCDGDGTFGRLRLPNESFSCYTVELPWLNNRNCESCIPSGGYRLNYRESNVVRETTGGEFTGGWEVHPVMDRSYIMLHPGNSIADLEGCIAPGDDLSAWKVDGLGRVCRAVTNSRDTFRDLMDRLSKYDRVYLSISWNTQSVEDPV